MPNTQLSAAYPMLKKLGLLFGYCYLLSCPSVAFSATSQVDRAKQRTQYLKAETALAKHHEAEYETLLKSLEDYPLYPYLIYQNLKQKSQSHPAKVPLSELESFKKAYPDFPHHTTLKKAWLAGTAKKKRWDAFIEGYSSDINDLGLQCQYYDIQYKRSNDNKWLDKADALWLTGKNAPHECDALFKTLKQKGRLTRQMLWKRIWLTTKQKNTTLRAHLEKSLTHQDKKIMHQWEKAIKEPALLLDSAWQAQIKSTPYVKQSMITQVALRLAKQSPEKALSWYRSEGEKWGLTAAHKKEIQHDIAMYLSHQKSALALPTINKLPKEVLDQSLEEWRVRLALAQEDYPKVLHAIYQLPETLQKEMPWQYWKARALEKTGKAEEAKGIYQYLAQHRSYYGLLASQRLNVSFPLNHHPLTVSNEALKEIDSKPHIERAKEFIALKRPVNARSEWFKGLEKLSTAQKSAAAKLADNWGAHDLAIATILKTPHKDDVYLRFPLAHRQKIKSTAHQYNLDPAWVFAIARQESAFNIEALSPVGARGLMQIMPDTGKSLAKNFDVSYHSENDLFQPELNIALGTAYLKDLKKSMRDHPVLATAAYNAGPTRTKKWLPEAPLDPEIWIETIPYRETREYVKNVLTYTAIYRKRLNTDNKASLWLEPIPQAKQP